MRKLGLKHKNTNVRAIIIYIEELHVLKASSMGWMLKACSLLLVPCFLFPTSCFLPYVTLPPVDPPGGGDR